MTDAPERIWIEDEHGDGHEDQWTYGTWDVRNYRGYTTEYVRADRIAKLDEENDILLTEVEYLEMMRDDLQKAFTRAADTRDRFRKLLTDIVDEYNDQVHGPILHSIVTARAELEAKP